MIAAAVAGIGPAHVILAAELTLKAASLALVVFLVWDARRSFAGLAAHLAVDVRGMFRAPAGRHRARRFSAPPTAVTAPPFAEAQTLVLPPLEIQ